MVVHFAISNGRIGQFSTNFMTVKSSPKTGFPTQNHCDLVQEGRHGKPRRNLVPGTFRYSYINN